MNSPGHGLSWDGTMKNLTDCTISTVECRSRVIQMNTRYFMFATLTMLLRLLMTAIFKLCTMIEMIQKVADCSI